MTTPALAGQPSLWSKTMRNLISTTLTVVAALAVSSVMGFASLAHSATLTIKVTDIAKASGTVRLKLVNSKEGYAGSAKAFDAQERAITSKDDLSFTFKDLKAGTYAVMLMHDENNNGKLDSNILGIPKEGYGFSNNPHVMRQPTFDETKFSVEAKDVSITIEVL
jgi:uncharacterized protein (DUF2141 family)